MLWDDEYSEKMEVGGGIYLQGGSLLRVRSFAASLRWIMITLFLDTRRSGTSATSCIESSAADAPPVTPT